MIDCVFEYLNKCCLDDVNCPYAFNGEIDLCKNQMGYQEANELRDAVEESNDCIENYNTYLDALSGD